MSSAVLCLLLASILQLSSISLGSSAGIEFQVFDLRRKLFEDPAPAPAPDTTVNVNPPDTLTVSSPSPTLSSPPPPKLEVKNITKSPPKASAPATAPPPTPWYLGGNSATDSSFAGYSYSFPQDMLNFTDAEAYCQKNHKKGHLVSIHSQAQQDFLNLKYVQGTAVAFLPVQVPQVYPPTDGVGHRGVWIGLRTKGQQGWTDGTSYDFDNFLTGKPDNWNGIEGCAQIYADTTPAGWSGWWDDIACESKMRFICAWPVVDAGNTYPQYNGTEYIYHSEIADWETAESTCWKLDNGHLVSIHSAAQADWIWKTFVAPKRSVDFAVQLPVAYQSNPNGMMSGHRGIWIGLNLQRGTPYWTDFTSYDYKTWAPSQPDNWNNIEFCTSLYVDQAPAGYSQHWDDLSCDAQLPFLCSRAANQSQQLYPQYNGWEYIMINNALDWMSANDSCVKQYNAQVVSFEGQEELSFVYQQYFQVPSNNYPVFLPDIYTDPSNVAAVNQSYVGIGRRGVWTGLIMKDDNLQWQWSDGLQSNFRSWIPGKPDNFQGQERCVQLYIDSSPSGWAASFDDLACTARCSVICKRKPVRTAVATPTDAGNPYASEILPGLTPTPTGVEPLLTDNTPANLTLSSKKSDSMSSTSVIALAVVGGFIGLLVISSVLWRFLRPASLQEEEAAVAAATVAGGAVGAIPTHYKGKAKATGVVHAPTGAGRVPPSKVTTTREPRPSKYVKIDVEDLEVAPDNFAFQPPDVRLEEPRHEVMYKH